MKLSLRVSVGRRVGQGPIFQPTTIIDMVENKIKINAADNGDNVNDVYTFVVDEVHVGQVYCARQSLFSSQSLSSPSVSSSSSLSSSSS